MRSVFMRIKNLPKLTRWFIKTKWQQLKGDDSPCHLLQFLLYVKYKRHDELYKRRILRRVAASWLINNQTRRYVENYPRRCHPNANIIRRAGTRLRDIGAAQSSIEEILDINGTCERLLQRKKYLFPGTPSIICEISFSIEIVLTFCPRPISRR